MVIKKKKKHFTTTSQEQQRTVSQERAMLQGIQGDLDRRNWRMLTYMIYVHKILTNKQN